MGTEVTGVWGRMRRRAVALIAAAVLGLPAVPSGQAQTGALELRFLNRTVEEGSWSSERPDTGDLKPMCGVIEIHAIYSGISRALRFSLDGHEVDRQEGNDVRLTWDTREWPDGRHRALIEVLGQGDAVVSAFSLILESRHEEDTEPPSVRIAFPPDGAVVRGVVTVRVDARDDHGITRVWLTVDGEKLAEATQFPFRFEWDTRGLASGGLHRLAAFAVDGNANTGSSEPVEVRVSNPLAVLTNPGLQGDPPAPWRVFGGCRMDRGNDADIGPFLRLTAGGGGPAGLRQDFDTEVPLRGALLSLRYRWGVTPSGTQSGPGQCRAELRDGRDAAVVAWVIPSESLNLPAWTETTVPLPELAPGHYRLAILAVPEGGSAPHCDLARVEVLIP